MCLVHIPMRQHIWFDHLSPFPSPSTLVWMAVGTGLGGNCTGCVICSEENGCSTCQQRLFLFIHREGIRQYGKCVHDCPHGYFGVRGQEVNRCRSTWLLPCPVLVLGSWAPLAPILSGTPTATGEVGVCLNPDPDTCLISGGSKALGKSVPSLV